MRPRIINSSSMLGLSPGARFRCWLRAMSLEEVNSFEDEASLDTVYGCLGDYEVRDEHYEGWTSRV